jgi:hypothetical protein
MPTPRPRIFVTQPVAKSAIARLRQVATVTVNPDSSRIMHRRALVGACVAKIVNYVEHHCHLLDQAPI